MTERRLSEGGQIAPEERHPFALLMLLGGACLLAVALVTLRNVSPNIDTSFQIDISREPTLAAFLQRVVSDNQAPAAQIVFWLASSIGFSSIDEQRGFSLLLASLSYLAAIFVGSRESRGGRGALARFAPTRAITLAAVLTVLSAGVFPISAFVRYSTLVGPIWLFVFIMCERYQRGEARLAFPIGLTVGLAFIVSYTALFLAISAAVSVLFPKRLAVCRTLLRMALGAVIGLVPVAAWWAFAGMQHVARILNRVEPAQAEINSRALIGKAYEMMAWVVVGPASLPTFSGLMVLAVIGGSTAYLILLAVRRGGIHLVPLLAFTVLVVPFLLATRTATGWSMVGPAAVVAFVAGLGAGSVRLFSSTALSMMAVAAALALLPAANVNILRPNSFASRASVASDAALRMARDPPALIVCSDWTTCLLTSGSVQPRAESIVDIAQFLRLPDDKLSPRVVLLFDDPGTSVVASRQREVRARMERLGYSRVYSEGIAPYEAMALRSRLGLNAQPTQYVVELWERLPLLGGGYYLSVTKRVPLCEQSACPT